MSKYCKISPSKNKYYLVRHTESLSNVQQISSYRWQEKDPLTEKGVEQAQEVAEKLRDYPVDLVFCSPFLRTKQTFSILNKILKIDSDKVFFDERLVENNFGIADEKHYDEFHKIFSSEEAYFETKVQDGENYLDTWKRLADFLFEIELKYHNKNILIISHGFPLRMLELESMKLNKQEAIEQLRISKYVNRGEVRPLQFVCN